VNKKILIFGKGFIGARLQAELNCAITDRMILSLKDAQEEIDKYKPKVIINCIGYTGTRNVDDCELDKDATLTANTFVPIYLAEISLRNKVKLVHISSGCIYHYDYKRDKPITEKEAPDFFDLYYSRTKIYAEQALNPLVDKYGVLIARIRIPLDDQPAPKNILSKLIKYGKIIDIPNSVTYIPDMVKALKHLIRIDAKGIYNVVNSTPLYYRDLMEAYKKYVPDFDYTMIKMKDLRLVRTNLLMSTEKLKRSGFSMPKIEDILDKCVREYVKK
jgi:3,5-epimerase/4-reductase